MLLLRVLAARAPLEGCCSQGVQAEATSMLRSLFYEPFEIRQKSKVFKKTFQNPVQNSAKKVLQTFGHPEKSEFSCEKSEFLVEKSTKLTQKWGGGGRRPPPPTFDVVPLTFRPETHTFHTKAQTFLAEFLAGF